MPMNLTQMIKNKLFEVEQPQSEGEKNFKALHKAVNHKNLVPGVTDQEHVFTGSTKPYDNKYPHSYKPGEDRAAYDKTLKIDNDETNNGYEKAEVEEALGTVKNMKAATKFSSSNISNMIRRERQRKAATENKRNTSLSSRASSNRQVQAEEIENIEEKNWIQAAIKHPDALRKAAKKAHMSTSEYEKKHMHDSGTTGKRARLAMTLKKLHKEEAESLDEAAWTEKNLPTGNYNQGGHTEKGDLHHIEVHPEKLKKMGISHQVSHAGEYGATHHFEHPSHGKVAVYQSDLNKKTGNPIMSVRTYGPQGAKPVAHKFAKKLAGNVMHTYNESVNEDYDDTPEEVSMVRTELKAIIADAQSLLDNMPSDMHIEPWVQSKIAVAKSMVNGVHDYMLYSDDAGVPSDQRVVPVAAMSNPFMSAEETTPSQKKKMMKDIPIAGTMNPPEGATAITKEGADLEEKLSPEKLKKFAKLAPPYNKITHADKIVAAKKKEAGQKILPEASMLGRECTNCGEGHYKEEKGKMVCDQCGHEAKGEMKEASMIKSHAMNMAKQAMHKMKPKMKHTMHTKMKKPSEHIKMDESILSDEEKARLDSIMNNEAGE
jgi:uncharacterized Zn finger protein (UPF0148 family)